MADVVVPMEVILHFPEKTHRVRGLLREMNTTSKIELNAPVILFNIEGLIFDWKEGSDGKPITPVTRDVRRIAIAGRSPFANRSGPDRSARARRRARSRNRKRANAAS